MSAAAASFVLSLMWLVEEPVELRWTAPAACPTKEQVLERATTLLGRPAETRDGERLIVEGVITKAEEGFSLELRAQMAAGITERSMTESDCEVLADVAAVVIAVAIDPLAALGGAESTPPTQPDPEPESAPVPVDKPAPPEAPPARVGPRGLVRIGAAVGVGTLPKIGPGLSLAAGVLSTRFRAEAYGTYWFTREARYETEASVGGRLSLWTAGARACVVPAAGSVSFPICAGAEGGLVSGRGVGLENPKINRQPWAAIVFGPHVGWYPIRRLGLLFGADLVVPLIRPGFGVDDLGPLHRAGPVAGRGKLGLEVLFP